MIWQELAEGRGPVHMDLRGKEPVVRRRRSAARRRNALLKDFEATPYQRPIEIGLGVLFMMGGVRINERCETSVSGLYAAGEVAANVHGAKRVPGNAFTEMIVFGARAGMFAAEQAQKTKSIPEAGKNQIEGIRDDLAGLISSGSGDVTPREIRLKVRSAMGAYVHMGRRKEGLEKALEKLETVKQELGQLRIRSSDSLKFDYGLMEGIDLRWLVHCAGIICRSALLRQESRGFHFRTDFSEEKEQWLKHTVVRRKRGDETAWESGVADLLL
jgi:succinate dehydrogenase/fumarate reductase flavoprotein subunit